MQETDVVVIGAGAMGSAAAWWLARRGADVVLLERFEQGHAWGSSHGGSRIFRFAYSDPEYVRMAQEALPLWRELENDAGVPLLDTTGAVDHGDRVALHSVADAMTECGAPFMMFGPEEAAERWPMLRFTGEVLFHPDGGRCRADATVRALHDRAGAYGADVRFETGPARLGTTKAGDAVEVSAGDETWRAPVAIVTAGSWVNDVVGDALDLPPLRITQEQVQHFRPLDPWADDAAWPSFIHHRVPWVYGLYTPGEGVKVGEHQVGQEIHPDRRAPRSADAEAAVVDYVREWFPGLDPDPINTAECLYTTTPDDSFVVRREGPIVVGSACSGHGFKFTPLIGRRLADLALA